MGSVLALDNSGSNWLRHGSARRHVVSLQMVMADGEVLEAGRHPITDDPLRDPDHRRRDLVRRLAELIDREEAVIKERQPKAWVNRSGYHLYDVVENGELDLARMLVGSEGTLGLITAATLRLFPRPRAGVAAWATCRTLADAVALMRRLRADFDAELVGYEAMNAASLALVERHFETLRVPLPLSDAGGAPLWSVLIDLASPHEQAALRERAEASLAASLDAGETVDIAVPGSEAQARTLWQLREAIPLAQGVEGLNIKHDIAVPLSALADFVDAADAALESVVPGARHITFGHLGDGNLHYNLQAPDADEAAEFLARNESAANACVYGVVERFGGTFSAEHGIGRLKRAELAARKPAPALAMMKAIKTALDPDGLFNPGVMLPD